MIEIIALSGLNMNHFTVQDAELYCQLSNINLNDITHLYLNHNKLTDISGVCIFKNLKYLHIGHNKTTDISPLQNLKKLESLYLYNNDLTDISPLKDLKKLEILDINYNEITDINVLINLINLKKLNAVNLKLSNKIQAVGILKKLPNLKYLSCKNTFKTVDIKKELKRKSLNIFET